MFKKLSKMLFCGWLVGCALIMFGGFAVAAPQYYYKNSKHKARWDKIPPQFRDAYAKWVDFIGESSLEMVEKNDPAPEVKPGVVITRDNLHEFPNLRKICDPKLYERLSSPKGAFCHIDKIRIVETRPWVYPIGVVNATIEGAGRVKVDPKSKRLLNWEAGVPFPHPKNGLEAYWDIATSFVYYSDELAFEPFAMIDFDKNNNAIRTNKGNLYVFNIMGRCTDRVGPRHVFPGYKYGDIWMFGSLVFTYPQDKKGMATVRTRYFDPEKPDRFISYVPSMRRIRLLSGQDAQDPIAGCEYNWDMWAGEWKKGPSNTIFPDSYRIIGEKTMLQPALDWVRRMEINGHQITGIPFEKRRMIVVEIKSLDPTYIYSKKIEYVDKEILKATLFYYYDRRGNLWRVWRSYAWASPITAFQTWEGDDIVNWIDKRRTVLLMNAVGDPRYVNPNYGSVRFLNRQVR